MASYQKGIPSEEWDDRQQKLGGHFLQSHDWARFQHALGKQVYFDHGDDWSWLAVSQGSRGVSYLYSPYGPTGKNSQGANSLLNAAKEIRADFVRLEPFGPVPEKAVAAPEMQPIFTQAVDLTQSEEELRSGLSSGHRNSINTAEKRGLKFRLGEAKESADFLRLLHLTAAQSGFRPYSDDYYQKLFETLLPSGSGKLFVAECDGKITAMSIGFDYHGTRYYAHAASDPKQKSMAAGAPLVWFMMTDAKAAAMVRFDLWGIAPDDDPNHPWAGFTKFKKAFGGETVEYAGTWDVPLKPVKYRLYRLAKRLMK